MEYKIVDCKCPKCGEPSAGFIDDLGLVELECYKCTMEGLK